MTPGVSVYISIVMVICVTGTANADMALRKARVRFPELFMKAPERAANAGYKMETHHVQTADGYIIGLHRLPGKKSSPPVLFQHGQNSMSDVWIAFGPKRSLAYRLVDSGYDVWLGNARGNLYSRNHTTLNPEEPEFWKFGLHEMGIYDLPAIIDYILNTTGQSRLFHVGHSLGGTVVHMLLSMKPEYNAKMRLVIGLAPGVFYKHVDSLPTISGIRSWPVVKELLRATEQYELLPYSEPTIALVYYICSNSTVQMAACEMLMEETFGKSDGLNKSEIPLMVTMVMGGNSAFSTDHLVQLVKSGKFQQFDFGPEENQRRYRSSSPPEYNLKMVTAPVAIHYGQTDKLGTIQDSVNLAKALPNVAELRRVPNEFFNHPDFIAHKRVNQLLYDHIVESMDLY